MTAVLETLFHKTKQIVGIKIPLEDSASNFGPFWHCLAQSAKVAFSSRQSRPFLRQHISSISDNRFFNKSLLMIQKYYQEALPQILGQFDIVWPNINLLEAKSGLRTTKTAKMIMLKEKHMNSLKVLLMGLHTRFQIFSTSFDTQIRADKSSQKDFRRFPIKFHVNWTSFDRKSKHNISSQHNWNY